MASRAAALCAALVAAIFLVYWPVASFDFVNLDDIGYVAANPHVLSGLRLDNLVWAFEADLGGNWHPLTWASLMLDAALFGASARGFHLTNLALHCLNGILVFLLVWKMSRLDSSTLGAPQSTQSALWTSAAVACFFALHPLRVESVAWVTERKDVLSGLFFLLSLWAYLRHAEVLRATAAKGSQLAGRSKSIPGARVFTFHVSRFYLLSLCCFVLGLMSKPMLVTLPFVLLLLDCWPLNRIAACGERAGGLATWARLVWEKAPFFLLSGIACLVTLQLQARGGAMADWGQLPVNARVQNALVSCARYLGKTFWPVDLSVLYPHPDYWAWTAVAGAGALVASLTVGVFWYGRSRPYLVMGWLWWLGTLVPVIGLVQVGTQAMADRYTYLPSIGLLTGVAWGVRNLIGRRLEGSGGRVAITALLFCLCLQTRAQLEHWRNSEALFRHALACAPDNFVAHDNLGLALATQGKLEAAIDHYRQAVQAQPNYAPAHESLALALAAQGNREEAIREYEAVLRLNPRRVEAHHRLGTLLEQKGLWAEAIVHYQEAMAIDPQAAPPRNNLAWVWATCPQAGLRDGPRAIQLALEADRLAGGGNAGFIDTLAAAYAEADHWPEAVATAERAVRLAEAQTNSAVAEIQAHLRLFQDRRKLRQGLQD